MGLWNKLPVWKKAWFFAIFYLGFVSIIDFYAMEKARALGMDLSISSPFMSTYLFSFWTLFLVSIIAFSFLYYYFIRRDKSEALIIFSSAWLMQNFGVEDVLYYLLRVASMPVHLDYLDSHWLMVNFAKLLGSPIVTPFTLIASAAVGTVLSYYIAKKLWRY